MAYIRKTVDEYRLYVDYGDGWEHETTEESRKEIRARMKEYGVNCPQYATKWSRHRVPV